MDDQPQEMIRAIRQALGMTQAEFGHALGWAPSTISRWEAGRGQPNRLAVKIILAFAEERRVRYRPRRELALRPPAMALPIPALPIPAASRPAVTVLPPAAPDGGWAVSAAATRPRWEAELNFRIALDRHGLGSQPRPGWRWKAGVAAATVGAVLLIGIPMSRHPAAHPRRERTAVAATAAAPAATPVADRQPAADTIAAAPAPVEAAASSATLEGVTVLGDVRQAMFRTPRETITVAEGAQLGERRATRIGAEGVELRGPDGRLQVIGIGGRVPID
ncbi:MAG: helix-turn-helix domain-containing protein [Deltaproteobacteria bacterium]|nr:MAG: helix-turn-helix domain-containing protein [Deltaproteobacteria bacterium]